ncbi:MAG: LL-diaminopimelate aminotransferase [Verrucomicrobia bacterium]|nr:LL-diaminopimelate aminotransferase [Verrucomicrobiota bacterium]
MIRNHHFEKVPSRYLFQEIRQKALQFQQKHPEAKLIRLGIGDTTEPIGPYIASQMELAAKNLATREGYFGYGPEQGIPELREAISKTVYNSQVSADDIFVSDGAKCDIGRLQFLFGPDAKIALQDPAYPVYLDSSLIYRGGNITFLPCTPENNFVPDITLAKGCDVLFLCMPNNPTGTVFTRTQLEQIVDYARKHHILIVFDTAYSFYVQGDYPKSIYEIDGAKEVAIEVGSFSKIAGFSGVRLGWTVVPEANRLKSDWMRINGTFFNGASILSQKGGIACLSQEGIKEVQAQVAFYLENTKMLAKAVKEHGFETYGGEHSPYLWARLKGLTSWQTFDMLLEQANIVTTPGSGFGPAGEGFIRISGFATRATVEQAIQNITKIDILTNKR